MANSSYKFNGITLIIGGSIFVVLALLIKEVVASPVVMLHQWGTTGKLLPLWLMCLLWLGGYFFMGGAWLVTLSCKAWGGTREVLCYKGGMFLVLGVFFSFVWYLLLFGMQAFLLSWLCLGVAIMMVVVCAVCYFRLLGVLGWCVILPALWWLYLLGMQLVVVLRM